MPRRSGVDIETTIYNRFRGADFQSDPSNVDKTRSPLCTNMVADAGGMPEKRCGWRTLHTVTEGGEAQSINGIFSNKHDGTLTFYCHAGTQLYTWTESTAPVSICTGLKDAKSRGVNLCGALWIVTGQELVRCIGSTAERVTELTDAYIPKTVITRMPTTGGGTSYEDVNMATPMRRNSFQTDGAATGFTVDSVNLDLTVVLTSAIAAGTSVYWDDDHGNGGKYWTFTVSDGAAAGDKIKIDFENSKATVGSSEYTMTARTTQPSGTDLSTLGAADTVTGVWAKVWDVEKTQGRDYTVCRELGKFTFTTAPAAPSAGSADGLEVKFAKTVSGYADIVNKCTICTTYGAGSSDRMVISGNPDHPNQDYISGLLDPTYWPDLNYFDIGIEGVAIQGYCRIGQYLAIVKEDNGQDSTVFFRSTSVDSSGKVTFSTQQAITGVGATGHGSFATLLDEPLFLSGTGIMAMTVNYLTGDRTGQNRSYYINARLTAEDLAEAEAVSYKGMYLIAFSNGHCYVLDGRQNKTSRSQALGDFCYEGYYWENIPARCWLNYENAGVETLYFGTADGKLCRFNTDKGDDEKYNDAGAAISAVWATKMDDDGNPAVYKTMLKRGCSLVMKPYYRSSASIGFRADQQQTDIERASGTADIFDWTDIDFARFSFAGSEGTRDIFFNTKVKKYKRLQIVIRNSAVNEGFGVYAITKHYVFGNFAKR